MEISREEIKKNLPNFLVFLIKQCLAILRKFKSVYRKKTSPVFKKFYIAILAIFPKIYWLYEQILTIINQELYDDDLLNRAREFLVYFKPYLDLNPNSILKWHLSVYYAYWLIHDHESLHQMMQTYIERQDLLAKERQLDQLGFRIANNIFFANYNTHGYLDTHIKAMLLGWQPRQKILVFVRSRDIVENPVMLEYWQKYVDVISNERTIKMLEPLSDYLKDDLTYTAKLNGRAVYIEYAKCIVQKEWEAQKRGPILQLKPEDDEFGRSQLFKLGLPKDAWFVSLHVRDSGYKLGSYLAKDGDSYRNADIDTYQLAIKEIVERGGWVIRVGDPNMKPMAPTPGVIDYAHSDIRSNRLDIFLFSQCRFFIGTCSGPILTAQLFKVPLVYTNILPVSVRPNIGNSIFLTKLLWLETENRYATFQEVLSSDLGRIFTTDGYVEHNIDIVDNSPEELRDVVKEMLDYVAGDGEYSPKDEELQQKLNELYRQYSGYGDMGRIGREFIKKYAEKGLI